MPALFLDTPREEYDRVLDINFGGVVNGCRSFASPIVDRGAGGHIVNVRRWQHIRRGSR